MLNKSLNNTPTYCVKENGARFLLSYCTTQAKNPLIVIGANPSKADEIKDDPTARKFKIIAEANGFDGVIIVNLYPLVCTNPNELPEEMDGKIHSKNKRVVTNIIKNYTKDYPETKITAWCAYGDLIKKRKYFYKCKQEILQLFPVDTRFVCIRKTKSGNPVHPLYCKMDSKLISM